MDAVQKALIRWLSAQDNKDQVMMASNGQSYTALELIQELENRTDLGEKLAMDIIVLTIDLLFRKKEEL